MSNLMATLLTASDALTAYGQVLDVVQNNVANASTPGYAKQTEQMDPLRFDPAQGYSGGVVPGEIVSSRNEYAEQAVQQQTTMLGHAQQDVNSLTAIQNQFDVTGGSGITAALNSLFQAFSAWAQSPDSAVARQNVVAQAGNTANAFQQTANGLSTVSQDTNQQLHQTVADINTLAGQLAGFNQSIMNGDHSDAGLDAQIHATLEQLSTDGAISATQQSDGTFTVLLNGQTPLVIQNRTYALVAETAPPDPNAPNALGPGHLAVVAADGTDITAQTTGGQLGSLLNLANVVLPGYLGDQNSPGSLNTLAASFANQVNSLLTGGYQSDGPPPVIGVPLFQIAGDNPTGAARGLTVVAGFTGDQLAAISPGPPAISNGVALALSQLADPTDSNDEIGGLSYTQYYGGMASNAGTLLANANAQLQNQQSAVAQAQNVRQQISGVSLDEEATIMLQFQQAYEANSKLITMLNQMSEDIINMIPTA